MTVSYFEKWFPYKKTGIGPLSVEGARERHEGDQTYVALLDLRPKVLIQFLRDWVSVSIVDEKGRTITEFSLRAEHKRLRLKGVTSRIFKADLDAATQFTMIALNDDGSIVDAEALGPSEFYKAFLASGSLMERPPFGEYSALLEKVSACARALQSAEDREAALLGIVARSSLRSDYYHLCRVHPLRSGAPPKGLASRELQRAASGRISLTKFSGPGHGYAVGGLPENVSLTLVIQGRTSVEADFRIPFKGTGRGGTIATLCHAATVFVGERPPEPPYPRPEFRTPDEFVEIALKLRALVGALAESVQSAAGP